jgi:hypothetical protein
MFKIIDHPSIKPNTYAVDEYGTVKNINTGKILKPYLNEHGYWYIGLQTPDGKRKQFGVYRLVALCHVPNPDPEHFDTVNHIYGVKCTNYYKHLEWCTNDYNLDYRYKPDGSIIIPINGMVRTEIKNKGYCTKGEVNGMSKWTEDQVELMCKMVADGSDYGEALAAAGIEVNLTTRANLSHIVKGHRWRHIASKYFDFGDNNIVDSE